MPLSALVCVLMMAALTMAFVPAQERDALVELYQTCDGKHWVHQDGWLSGDPCEQSWYGVTCDVANSTVLQLDTSDRLAFNVLNCELPASIGNLTNITQLYLSNDIIHSHIRGQLPSSMASLTHLNCLYLSHGDLTGVIPSWLASLPLLQGLYLRHNGFSGPLPDLSNLTYLEDLWLDTQSPGSGVTGSIEWMSNLPYLDGVHMENNALSGPLPAALCAMGHKCHGSGNNFTCPSFACCGVSPCRTPKHPSPADLRNWKYVSSKRSPLPFMCTRHQ